MKKRLLALAAACLLLLSSCASMLERSYSSVSLHVDNPATAEDPSILRVENYRELVSAVLYLVSRGSEVGKLRLYDYSGDVGSDLARACAEVATQDPLGAYAVDFIRHEYVKVVSYYEATLTIGYRRTVEQMRSIVNVTGTGAIRTQLQQAMGQFASEVLLRVAYFSQDEASIAGLLREVYYDSPATALGMPRAQINLYPDSGRERVVEILLTWPDRDLAGDSGAMTGMADALMAGYGDEEDAETLARGAARAMGRVTYDPSGPANPCDALNEGRANSEGMALTYALLCQRTGLSCEVAEGTLRIPAFPEEPGEEPAADPEPAEGSKTGEEPLPTPEPVWTEEHRFWNTVTLPDGRTLCVDPARGEDVLYSEMEFFDLGYRWEGGPEEPETVEVVAEASETTAPEHPAGTEGG